MEMVWDREQRKPRKGSGVQTLRLDAYITLYVDELAFNDIADKNSVISERGGLMSDIINTSKLLGVCKVNSIEQYAGTKILSRLLFGALLPNEKCILGG